MMVKSSIKKLILSTSCKTPVQHTQEGFCAKDQGCSMGLGAEELGTEGNLGPGLPPKLLASKGKTQER